ncbi:hypothetical protein Syun_012534 [Stephania yunnanensis]|uniref:Uncharacterized protein n=1 Tax=Stephania yunnanensis TaxID=152371 RepID=A0AAP0K0D3_9MAGN
MPKREFLSIRCLTIFLLLEQVVMQDVGIVMLLQLLQLNHPFLLLVRLDA